MRHFGGMQSRHGLGKFAHSPVGRTSVVPARVAVCGDTFPHPLAPGIPGVFPRSGYRN